MIINFTLYNWLYYFYQHWVDYFSQDNASRRKSDSFCFSTYENKVSKRVTIEVYFYEVRFNKICIKSDTKKLQRVTEQRHTWETRI